MKTKLLILTLAMIASFIAGISYEQRREKPTYAQGYENGKFAGATEAFNHFADTNKLHLGPLVVPDNITNLVIHDCFFLSVSNPCLIVNMTNGNFSVSNTACYLE